MYLERSREALRQATQLVEELRAAKDNSELFRDKFPFAIAAVHRVGSIIDYETKGHRTQQFGDWWKETQHEPLFLFLREVRNAEFKRGERQQVSVVFASATIDQRIIIEGTALVLDRDGGVVEDSEALNPPSDAAPEPPKPSTDPSPRWEFVGVGHFKGGEFDGYEVFALLDRYIGWLRETILPTAERLTKDYP
jgi:hypothetical protein